MGICLSKYRHRTVGANVSTGLDDTFDGLQELSQILNERIAAERRNDADKDSSDDDNEEEECIVVCDGREYPVRIKLLCKSSPYFTAMFACHMKEARSKRVEIKEVDPEILEMTLRFIQYSVLPDVDVDELLSLLCISNMFFIKDLYARCCRVAIELVDVDNYKEFWELSRLQNTESLCELLFDFVARNFFEVQHELKRLLDRDEMARLMKILRRDESIEDSEVMRFVSDWVGEDVVERRRYKQIMYFMSGTKKMRFVDVDAIVRAADTHPKRIVDDLREFYAAENVKIFLQNHYNALWFYSVHQDKLLKLIAHSENRNRCERVCGTIDGHVYVFKKNEGGRLDVLKCHVHSGNVSIVPSLDGFFDFLEAVVVDDEPHVVFMTDGFGYVMHAYDTPRGEWTPIELPTRYNYVRTVVAVDDGVCVIGTDREGCNSIDRWSVTDHQWRSLNCPPNVLQDVATSCSGELYLVRHPKIVETIQWKIGSPKPSRIQKYEKEGIFHVRYFSYCTSTDCEVVSKEKMFLRHDSLTDGWCEVSAPGGPAGITQVLAGPSDRRIKNPHIYVIDDDNRLHQFNVESRAWKMLFEFPRAFRLQRQVLLEKHVLLKVPLSTISY